MAKTDYSQCIKPGKKFFYDFYICMRITSLNSINEKYNFNIDCTVRKDINFTGSSFSTNFYDSFTRNPINKLADFTLDEYNKLTPEDVETIRKKIRTSFSFSDDLVYHNLAVSAIKSVLDETFGAGNYKLITMGRSISSVAKCLGYEIGEDNVKQIPMSNAGRFAEVSYIEDCDEDFDAFNQYLNSIGLSKSDVESSAKMHIITDYCSTGLSLCGVEKLLASDKVWGKQDNVRAISIMRLIRGQEDSSQLMRNMFYANHNFRSLIENMFVERDFKHYSILNKCAKLADTQKAVIAPINYSQEIKYFLFKFMDNKVNKIAF